jgi:hypothetical protein
LSTKMIILYLNNFSPEREQNYVSAIIMGS